MPVTTIKNHKTAAISEREGQKILSFMSLQLCTKYGNFKFQSTIGILDGYTIYNIEFKSTLTTSRYKKNSYIFVAVRVWCKDTCYYDSPNNETFDSSKYQVQ